MLEFAPRRRSIELRVLVADDVIAQMAAVATDPDSETGGVLVGRYSTDGIVAHVDLATAPPGDSSAGVDWFERGKEGLAEILLQQWNRPERRYYLGEWHYHPLGRAEPSPQDRRQMAEIARDANYKCPLPLLVIASPATLRRRTVRAFLLADGELLELAAVEPESR